jgi:hypothetical protein
MQKKVNSIGAIKLNKIKNFKNFNEIIFQKEVAN